MTISRLALLQCLIVVIGVLTTCGILKLNAYDPSVAVRWNPVAVAVRNFGYLLLIVPAIWTAVCLVLERRTSTRWNRTWTIASGLLFTCILNGLLWWTTATPLFFQKVPMQGMVRSMKPNRAVKTRKNRSRKFVETSMMILVVGMLLFLLMSSGGRFAGWLYWGVAQGLDYLGEKEKAESLRFESMCASMGWVRLHYSCRDERESERLNSEIWQFYNQTGRSLPDYHAEAWATHDPANLNVVVN